MSLLGLPGVGDDVGSGAVAVCGVSVAGGGGTAGAASAVAWGSGGCWEVVVSVAPTEVAAFPDAGAGVDPGPDCSVARGGVGAGGAASAVDCGFGDDEEAEASAAPTGVAVFADVAGDAESGFGCSVAACSFADVAPAEAGSAVAGWLASAAATCTCGEGPAHAQRPTLAITANHAGVDGR